jgi:hypothetical protein
MITPKPREGEKQQFPSKKTKESGKKQCQKTPSGDGWGREERSKTRRAPAHHEMKRK